MPDINLPLVGFSPHTNSPETLYTTDKRPYLAFDDTTDEMGIFTFDVPADYSSGMEIDVRYSMDTAATGNVAIRTEWQLTQDGENIETDSWSTKEKSADTAVPGTATFRDTITDPLGNPTFAAGDTAHLRFGRDNTAASNANGDMFVWSLKLRYTAA